MQCSEWSAVKSREVEIYQKTTQRVISRRGKKSGEKKVREEMRRERMCAASDREDATEKEKNGVENQSHNDFQTSQ